MVRALLALCFVALAVAVGAMTSANGIELAIIAGGGAIFITSVARSPRLPRLPRPQRTQQPQLADANRALLDAIVEPMLLVTDGRVRHANGAACALLGKHIIGENVRLAIRHPAAAEHLATDAPSGGVDLIGLGGRDQRIRMEVATLSPTHRLIHLIDRTTSHAAERARVDFVANASHELRTPLAAIIGFIETLDDDSAASDPSVRVRFLKVMMKEARRMQRLIDDLISLSRIEAEKYSLPTTPVLLESLIEEVANELRDNEGGARAQLEFAIEQALPPVPGDRAQLSQVVHNLVGNALKYGNSNFPVTIALALDGQLLRLSVTDRGDGIEPEHIPRLTERFYRVDSGRSRSLGGTGLGLAIVKHIVERHRGRLDIVSNAGEGTTVSVLLPTVSDSPVMKMSSN